MAHTDHHLRGPGTNRRKARKGEDMFIGRWVGGVPARQVAQEPAPEGVVVQVGAHMATRPVMRLGKTARKAAAKRLTATWEALGVAEANAFAAEAHYGERTPEARAYWAAHSEAFAAYSAACSEVRYQRALAQLR